MNVTALIFIGLLVGGVGGMFGVGGGIILIPALTEVLGPNQHLYQSTSMIVNLFVAVPAVYQHRCAKAIDFGTVLRIAPLAVIAVLLGVAVSELRIFSGPGEAYLRGLFGMFLMACALYDAHRLWRRVEPTHDETSAHATKKWRLTSLALIAIPTGFSSGLLGIGGGVLAVPLQRRLLHVPMRTAIANSAAIIAATSLVGAIFKNYAYLHESDVQAQPILLAAFLLPGAVIGSVIGSRMVHRIPLRFVKGAFVVLLLVASIRLMYGALESLY